MKIISPKVIILYTLSSILYTFASCKDYEDPTSVIPDDAVEMRGVNIALSRTAGVEVAQLTNYVGRKEFSDQDVAVFTTIKRTESPINQFTYKDLEFLCSVETKADVTSVGWSRIMGKGTTAAGTSETAPDRIYWTDATSPHTFIGYCTPQQGADAKAFDWGKYTTEGHNVYYGSIGDPTVTGDIDYREDSTKLQKDDILLTYSENIKAEDAIARLRFHHGLAQVRVIVNISDFAAGGDNNSADKKTVVSDMKLIKMLTMYKWNQLDSTTTKLTPSDNAALNSLYTTNTPAYDQKKNVLLWIPNPEGVGEGASKTFTFYALAVPTEITDANPQQFSFGVTYPNPMNPSEMQTKTYAASIKDIRYSSGKCTTINISLNHRNEKLTVGAQYDDWDFVESPDQGALKKNSTFLSSTDRTSVTILGDEKATADDATWLYHNGEKVVDIYGNDGSQAKPFTISTAKQLLSFAYEVKGTNRTNTTSNDGHSAGWDFSGKYVKLDADIHLQSVLSVDSITVNKKYNTNLLNWIGIGDNSHAFNGIFDGGGRNITYLSGKAFFSNIGGQAIVSEINLSDVVTVTDHGALAEQNGGFVYACRVEGNVESNSEYVGSLCGINTGFIFACIHNGTVKGTLSNAKVGGLIGRNGTDDKAGTIAVSYHTGAIQGTETYGVVERSFEGSKIYACYFNSTLVTPNHTVDAEHVQGRTLGQMQSRSFATTDLNAKIQSIVTSANHEGLLDGLYDAQKTYFLDIIGNYYFVFTPGAYPRVEKKTN